MRGEPFPSSWGLVVGGTFLILMLIYLSMERETKAERKEARKLLLFGVSLAAVLFASVMLVTSEAFQHFACGVK